MIACINDVIDSIDKIRDVKIKHNLKLASNLDDIIDFLIDINQNIIYCEKKMKIYDEIEEEKIILMRDIKYYDFRKHAYKICKYDNLDLERKNFIRLCAINVGIIEYIDKKRRKKS
jgi:hypothetical protein